MIFRKTQPGSSSRHLGEVTLKHVYFEVSGRKVARINPRYKSLSMDFNAPPGGKTDSANREQLMDQVKQQIALANAQELLQKMSEKCFKKCVTKPGTSLDNSEQKCIAMCMDRYMDSWNLVSRVYSNRLQRERTKLH